MATQSVFVGSPALQSLLGAAAVKPKATVLMRTAPVEVPAPEPTGNEMQDQINALIAENARLKAGRSTGRLSIRVSEKGAVSVYGLGRFPVTLYKEQMRKLLAHSAAIEAFIVDNEDSLATKEQ